MIVFQILYYTINMQFRPKNFAKPAQVKTEEAGPSSVGAGAEVVKQEPVSPRASHRKSPQRLNRRNREVMQDTVTFGGGIGGELVFFSVDIGWCVHV